MPDYFIPLVLVVILALVFDYINGFHDTANSIATVVSTRVLRPSQAVMMAGVLNMVGAFIGIEVAKTIGKGIVETNAINQITVLGALTGAIIWNLITWYYGIPSSSSHAIIGGLCGASAAYGGIEAIKIQGLINKVFFPMISSPIIGISFGFIFMLSLYWLMAKAKTGWVSRLFSKLQLVSSGFMALSHGQNDAQKTMGIITMALISYTVFSVSAVADVNKAKFASKSEEISTKHQETKEAISFFVNEGGFIINEEGIYKAYLNKGKKNVSHEVINKESDEYKLEEVKNMDSEVTRQLHLALAKKELNPGEEFKVEFTVPFWVVISCAMAMALGTMAGGWRIINTMGSKMIKLQPIHGFAAETSAAIMISAASHFGMPVSTTHIISTSIMGVGASKRFSAVKWGIVGNILVAWILTFPITFILGFSSFFLLNFFFG